MQWPVGAWAVAARAERTAGCEEPRRRVDSVEEKGRKETAKVQSFNLRVFDFRLLVVSILLVTNYYLLFKFTSYYIGLFRVLHQ